MTAWLGVVSGEHVARGVALEIAQIGHGKRAGLARMRRGDTLIYYSPAQRFGDTTALRRFTAIRTISGDEIWQAEEGDFHPFRRKVDCRDAHSVPVEELKAVLELTGAPNWGYRLRRGLLTLSDTDAAAIEMAMTSS